MAKERMLSTLDRMIQRSIGREATMGGVDDDAQTKWPELWRWITSTDAGRDYVKDPAKITLRAVPGGFHVALQDIDLCVSVEVVTPHLCGFAEALEAALTSACPPVKKYGRTEKNLRKRKTGG